MFTLFACNTLIFFSAADHAQQAGKSADFFNIADSDFSRLDRSAAADAFGICSASYEILAVGPNTELFRQFANGAKMALGMIPVAYVIDKSGGHSDKIPADHPELVEAIGTAQRAGMMILESETTTHRTRIVSTMSADPEYFSAAMENTIGVCQANLDYQQEYVDLWRDLVAGGWIQLR